MTKLGYGVAAMIILVGGVSIYYVGKAATDTKAPPVVLEAPIIPSPQVIVQQEKVDLSVLQRNIHKMRYEQLEIAYGPGCFRAPNKRIRLVCKALSGIR